MTGTQEARGEGIEGGRLVAESFHKGQDLSAFGHPCWAGITNSGSREGTWRADSRTLHFYPDSAI